MGMKAKVMFLLGLLILSGAALGQGCPAGIPSAGNPGCIPPDRENSPYYQGEYGTTQPSIPRGHWQLTWGAIAMDSTTWDIGASSGQFSRWAAKREAIARCKKHGATKCTLEQTYENQCAVIAWASENGKSVAGSAMTVSGPTIESASQRALADCKKMRNGRECKIIYTDCTKPVLVQ